MKHFEAFTLYKKAERIAVCDTSTMVVTKEAIMAIAESVVKQLGYKTAHTTYNPTISTAIVSTNNGVIKAEYCIDADCIGFYTTTQEIVVEEVDEVIEDFDWDAYEQGK